MSREETNDHAVVSPGLHCSVLLGLPFLDCKAVMAFFYGARQRDAMPAGCWAVTWMHRQDLVVVLITCTVFGTTLSFRFPMGITSKNINSSHELSIVLREQ